MDCADKIKEIRKMSGMSRRDFCDTYQIPYQTVTDWELGHRNAPEYVLRTDRHIVLTRKPPRDYEEGRKVDLRSKIATSNIL